MEGGEGAIQGPESRVGSGKEGLLFLPLGTSRWVNREIAGGDEGWGDGCRR